MNKKKIIAGIDAGHINTKAVLMEGQEVMGYASVPTSFDPSGAAQAAINRAANAAGVSLSDLAGLSTTGIYRDIVKLSSIAINLTVPEYMADAKGALLLNKNSRSVIDIGGNIHKAILYNEKGNLVNVIQNDKCADGLGIFLMSISKALDVNEDGLSELALKSTKDLSVDIHCTASAEVEAFGLLCQGENVTDVANAIVKFIVERVASMCTYLSLTKEIVVAGGLAKSKAIFSQLSGSLKQEMTVSKLPEYIGAIGAIVSYEGEK